MNITLLEENADNLNYGMAVLNSVPCGSVATIIATGLGRSGTTMIARIMEEIGLEMGDNLTPNTREYKALQVLVKAGNSEAIIGICQEQSRKTPKWGFKVPAFRNHMAEYEDSLQNPRFIVIFRDILAISLRNNISVGAELMSSIANSLNGYSIMMSNVSRLKSPVLMLSYEKALQFPEQIVSAVAVFMGFDLSAERIAEIAKKVVRNSDPRYLGR